MHAFSRRSLSRISFAFALSLMLGIALFYVYNIVIWGEQPDIGLYRRMATGIHTVGVVTDPARKAGVQVGDHVLKVNGKTFGNRNELLSAINWQLGEKNTYLIERNGQQFEVTIPNNPLGLWASFTKSGLPFLAGFCYVVIGTLVFLMKPHQRTSWIFFLFSGVFGLLFAFWFKASVLQPYWLGTVDIFLYAFTPAVTIHLALNFPEERSFIRRNRQVQLLPYLASVILFACIRSTTPEMMGISKFWFTILIVYFLAAILFFLGSCLQLRLTSLSEIIKLRSRMILLGAAICASLPLLETFVNTLFQRYLVPNFNYYLPFFIVFPLFVGYSIIKHNLFDIDAIIKRTYGYVVTTAGISGIYILVLAVFNYVFGSYELTESPIFTLLFILAVVFLFSPVRNRIQKIIDRFFYRLEYDYQEAVGKISEALRSLLSLDEIEKRIMENSARIMFIESGSVLLLNPKEQIYETLTDPSSTLKIPADDPLIQKITFRKKEVTLYDIQEDPFYVNVREACRRVFKLLEAALIMPMIYEDRLIGLISLGRKKSGKFYRREDIKLLKILANQGAVAVQNARLADQMKSEEMVRANLARYLSPQIVERIIQKDVQVNLGGDKKIVTVLFSDIRDFTRISETLSPDQLVQLLNEYFTEMARIIFENQGSLDKFIGDAIVAVFGSLISIHNPARAAVQSAIHMMKTLEAANQRWTVQYGVPIHIGIGINTGEVLLGNIGSPERMEFTVIGNTVNIASRLSGMARPGKILTTQETSTQMGTDFHCQSLPPIEVKGKTGKLEVFEIIYS